MSSPLYKTIGNQNVFCVLMTEDGGNLFFSESNPTNFTNAKEKALVGEKENLFDKVSSLTNWDEIAGRVVFLSENEYAEIFLA